MAEMVEHSGRGGTVLRWLVAAAFVAAIILSGFFSGLTNGAGLVFLVAGSVAAALLGFSRSEIGEAFRYAAASAGPPDGLRRAAYFWEAAARNAWVLGVLGSALSFTAVLGGGSEGIADSSNRMIQCFIVTLYGLVLAVVCLAPAMKLEGMAGKEALPQGPRAGGTSGPGQVASRLFERVTGAILFAAVLGFTIISLSGGKPQNGPVPLAKVILHGPAILVVFGGAIALVLFMGAGAGARAWTLGFSLTGLTALLLGLIQALFGFVHASVEEIATAIAFIISASSFAMLGLVVIAAPLEDREAMESRRGRPGPPGRTFWVVLPLLTFIFLVLSFIMVVTPITKPGG